MTMQHWNLRGAWGRITPCSCTRGKVFSLSVCHCCRCCCCPPQQQRQDLQVQMSCEWHKTVKIGKRLMYLCSYLLLTIYMLCLFATPIEAIQLCTMTAHAQALCRWLHMPKLCVGEGSSNHKLQSKELEHGSVHGWTKACNFMHTVHAGYVL